MKRQPLAEIPQQELQALGATARSMGVNELAGESLQLRVLDGGRQWIIETAVGQLVANIDDPTSTHAQDDVFYLSERICRFADCFGDETVALCTGDDQEVIAYAAGANAVIDLVPRSGQQLMPWQFVPSASAVVSMRRFQMLLSAARCVPAGVELHSYPRPPIWLQMDEGAIGLHVNWSDFVASKAIYSLDAVSHAWNERLSIPHDVIESLLRMTPEAHLAEPDAAYTITIGTVICEKGDHPAIMLSVLGWRLVLSVAPPATERWAEKLNEVFAAEGIEVAATDGIEWAIAGNFEVQAKLHHGYPDVARVTAVLLRNAEESIELFRELGQLNAASNHIRYWLDEGEVRSAVDVQCTELQRLPDIVRQVAAAAAKYAPMLAVLSSTA